MENGTASRGGSANRLSFPDVKIRDLPFFPVKSVLLKPCAIMQKTGQDVQQQNLAFYLSPEQANLVNSGRKMEPNGMVVYRIHVLLRFTRLHTDSVQDDDFPKNLCLKVNNKICPLPNPKPVPANRPNMEAKRPPKPLIITSLCKLNSKMSLNQQVTFTWTAVQDVQHTVSVYLVEKLTPSDLLKQLVSRGQRDADVTKKLICAKLSDKESEISTTSCKVSLACPLGMVRMNLPCRASTCDHLQCFDADLYLKMNEKKPKWICPVCNKPAYFENLFLDGFYTEVLKSSKLKAIVENDILLNSDATWEPVVAVKDGVTADSDDDEEEPAAKRQNGAGEMAAAAVDKDGAPVLSSLGPAAAAAAAEGQEAPPAGRLPDGSTTSAVEEEDDDVLVDKQYPPDEDYMDWNFSVKFFRFIREPPPQPKPPTPPPDADSTTVDDEPTKGNKKDGGKNKNKKNHASKNSNSTEGDSDDDEEGVDPKRLVVKPPPPQQKRSPAAGGRGRGRGGRGRGRGAKRKSAVVSDNGEDGSGDEVSSSAASKRPAARGRGRGGRARGRGAAKTNKRSRYAPASSDDESSGAEAENSAPPPARTSSRPARNCRRSTNYADLEKAFEEVDSDEFDRMIS